MLNLVADDYANISLHFWLTAASLMSSAYIYCFWFDIDRFILNTVVLTTEEENEEVEKEDD